MCKQKLIKIFFIINIFLGEVIFFAWGQKEDLNAKIIFSYKYSDSNIYAIETENYQTVREDGRVLISNALLENYISVEIKKRNQNDFLISQNTEFSEEGHLIREEKSLYEQDVFGTMDVPNQYITPLARDIPLFLANVPIAIGDTWENSGTDTIHIPFSDTFERVPVEVSYTYNGYNELPSIAYDLVKRRFNRELEQPRVLPLVQIRYNIVDHAVRLPNSSAWRIDAKFIINIWWNNTYGRVEFYSEDYSLTFTDPITVTRYTFSGVSTGYMMAMLPLERQKDVEIIKKKLKRDNVEADVVASEKGVLLTINNIQFSPDSAILLDSEKQKLIGIIKILREYPNRRILIEGHTALVGVKEQRKRLSILRAKVVKEYIKKILGRKKKILFKGYGAEKPIASNKNEKGRTKNRRVEITILEN